MSRRAELIADFNYAFLPLSGSPTAEIFQTYHKDGTRRQTFVAMQRKQLARLASATRRGAINFAAR